jgi:hypothetical protein
MRLWGDRYSRDLRRYTLAWRMVSHEARSQTVAAWTGLPKSRIRTLVDTHQEGMPAGENLRHRGPSPNSVAVFLRTAQVRREAAALIGVCYAFKVLPETPVPHPRRELPGVARGERLCEAYEMYRSMVPETCLTLDHAAFLVICVAQAGDLDVQRCTGCGSALVLNRYDLPRSTCSYCTLPGAAQSSAAILLPRSTAPSTMAGVQSSAP